MPYPVQRETSSVRLSLVLAMIILGVLLIGGAILGILSLADMIRGHSGASWHHFTAWFDSIKRWLIAGGIGIIALKFGFPLLEMRAHTALPRAEARKVREEARRIRKETQFLEDLHYHNLENLPATYLVQADEYGNYPQMIGPDGRPVAFLLPGNAGQSTGTSGIPHKLLLDFLQQQNTVEADNDDEEPVRQIEAPKRVINLSDQIEEGLTMPDEEESVFGYPIDTYEPFLVRLFEREGNFVNSLFVVGQQNQGKSTIGTYFAALTVNHRGYLLVIDPDAQIAEQSLSSRLGPLKQYLLSEIADTPEKAKRLLEIAENEIDHPSDFPLLLLVDEFSLIMRHGKAGGKWQEVAAMCASTVENYATRGRKRLRRAVVFGQISNASRTGGTELRDSCAQIVFNTPYKKALLVLQDADDDEIAELAPSLTPGTAIVLQKSETYIMQFTFPDERGLRIIAEVRAESDELLGQRHNPLPYPHLRVLPQSGTQRDADPEQSAADPWDRGLVPQNTDDGDSSAHSEKAKGTSPLVPRVPQGDASEPVEPVPTSPAFVSREDDKIVPDHLHDDLSYYYAKSKDVKIALHTVGLSNRYFRHASWVLEDRGLKARKA